MKIDTKEDSKMGGLYLGGDASLQQLFRHSTTKSSLGSKKNATWKYWGILIRHYQLWQDSSLDGREQRAELNDSKNKNIRPLHCIFRGIIRQFSFVASYVN